MTRPRVLAASLLATIGLTTVGMATVGLAGTAQADPAGPPERLSASFDEPPVATMVDGLGTGCPTFTGTLTELRHLQIEALVQPGGIAHARTLVDAAVTLVPDDPTTPTYTGGYTSRQTGLFTVAGDDDRVVTTTTHGTITSTDGTSYRISEVVHVTLDGQGSLRASFDRFHCS